MLLFSKLNFMAPFISVLLVVGCVGYSLSGYEPTEYTPVSNMNNNNSNIITHAKGNFDLDDGVYSGTGVGYAGKIGVDVTVKDKQIEGIVVTSVEADDTPYVTRAKGVIEKIILAQTWEVDVMSGATYSSRGIINATKNAITGEVDTNAIASSGANQGKGSTSISDINEPSSYKDGTYYGSGMGFNGTIKVKVVIKEGKISSISVVSTSDDASYFNKAKKLISKIISKQTTNVDTVSGATYSSTGIIKAVRNALKKAAVDTSKTKDNNSDSDEIVEDEENTQDSGDSGSSGSENVSSDKNATYKDGTYTAVVKCSPNSSKQFDEYNLTVTMTISNGKITKFSKPTGDGSLSNKSYITSAYKGVSSTFLNKNIDDISSIDTVSGATCTCESIVAGYENIIKQAKEAASKENDSTEEVDETGNAPLEVEDNNSGESENQTEEPVSETDNESETKADTTQKKDVVVKKEEPAKTEEEEDSE